ncbi:uncharacterized protein [Littorina saxatilis]|uniref:Pseudouridylate synthase RPUSD4, mitochondrial n=1 Tax=Littorina saxatilis TaxID=31220 RepID=A0AAN9AJH1_9CAEN
MAAPLRSACSRRIAIYNNFILGQNGCQALRVFTVVHKHSSQNKQEDFFGIAEDQRSGNETEWSPTVADEKRREAEVHTLLRSLQRKQRGKEIVVQAHFGQVRLDNDARKSYLGDLDPEKFLQAVSKSDAAPPSGIYGESEEPKSEASQRSKRHRKAKQESKSAANDNSNSTVDVGQTAPNQHATSYFDEQYFGSVLDVPHNQNDGQTPARDQQQHPHLSNHDGSFQTFSEKTDSTISRSALGAASHRVTDISVSNSNGTNTINEDTPSHFLAEGQFPYVSDSSNFTSVTSTNVISKHNQPADDSFIDEQYFPYRAQPQERFSQKSEVPTYNNMHETSSGKEKASLDSDLNFIDAQYFDSAAQTFKEDCKHKDGRRSVSTNERDANQADVDDVNFIDAQYFGESHVPEHSNPPSFDNTVNQYGVAGSPQVALEGYEQSESNWKRQKAMDGVTEPTAFHNSSYAQTSEPDAVPAAEHISASERSVSIRQTDRGYAREEQSTSTKRSKQIKEQKPSATLAQDTKNTRKVSEEDDSAYDVAMKMRRNLRLNLKTDQESETLPKDKKRLVEMRERVPDIHRMPAVEVAQLLADSIIFENDDFIAIHKPYGLPSHGGPGVRVSVGQVLKPLSERFDSGQKQLNSLHLVHRLDKETTGVMLLAKNAEVAWQLLGMFRRREVGKTYWTITKGLPQLLEGVVDIPLARQKVGDIYKTAVKPREYASRGQIRTQKYSRRDDRSKDAVTEYHVLAHRDNMALVECRPLTGVQHQIRAHLAQALNAPVLGDHKYSHSDRLAPQKLFPEALQKLGIRQAQVRHVPLHLHAKGLLLPEWRGKTNIFIKANVPRFFLKSLKSLQIKIPPK